ncbi:sigma-54 interaction domain-containing protein [Pontibacillus salicampi]|uniref:Sigma-54 interaction domain-containing protein n=1 Tax=Pontibacillus salicampi TaxID=1449801 RepID=A0ABV6LMG7_9BACI
MEETTSRELIILAGTVETASALHQQLKEILGEYIAMESYAAEDYLPSLLSHKVVIYSSDLVEQEVEHIVDASCDIITARRTTNYQYIDQLFHLPEATKVLYVNDFQETAQEAIETLQRIGINHLQYIPYYPSISENVQHIDTAITPGEVHLVPDHVENVINIGVRLIDITTLMEILEKFYLKDRLGAEISDRYTRKIIELSKRISEINQQTVQLHEHLKQVVDGINDGIVAIDKQGKISVYNQMMENYTGVLSIHAFHKQVQHIVKNQEILSFIFHEEARSRLLTINQQQVMVYKFHLQQEETTILIFKNTDETISMEKAARKELVQKGYVAKYTFEHIIGDTPQLLRTENIARKLAKSELPVLIHGESGTGKELYANSIHNVSSRHYQPFLAMNFSALPEELLESELFGYEEGAFTGAQKGGKKGVFEQADGGTLFLDEIGDISLKLQARLLRVIQEMEIRRIGGNKNIPIDVRIIAATNKDLHSLMKQGYFREDLYHRIKVLYLQLPPLRERKEDIPLLIYHFIKEQTKQDIHLSPEVVDMLQHASWYGNIRELKNTISYMLAVRESNYITIEDLPAEATFQANLAENQLEHPVTKSAENWMDEQEWLTVLHYIHEIHNRGERASRHKIMEIMKEKDEELSEQQIRLRLNSLKDMGFVSIGRGRKGTSITSKGIAYLQQS